MVAVRDAVIGGRRSIRKKAYSCLGEVGEDRIEARRLIFVFDDRSQFVGGVNCGDPIFFLIGFNLSVV